MTLLEYALLFFSVLLGGGIGFYFRKNYENSLKLALSFSGAFILGITVLHLMPEVYSDHSHIIGLWIIVGFMIQLGLEQVSRGIEHGHIHADDHHHGGFAFQVVLGLCLHAFMEGMPVAHYAGHHHHNYLLYGVILHKAPAAFALVLLLLFSKYKNSTVLLYLMIFALMSPLGAIFSSFFIVEPRAQRIILAIVIGSFLHIATTILFEVDGRSHQLPFQKLIAIIVGVAAALLTII